jgi:hypothetical protein
VIATKLPRTIRLDPSDTFVFDRPAEPGEWAVTGSFLFIDTDPTSLTGKARAAFRSGFAGVSSLGFSTLVVVSEATPAEAEEAIATLARQIRGKLGAPDDASARAAAEEEIAFAASLCGPPVNTILAMHRTFEGREVREQFRTLSARSQACRDPTGFMRACASSSSWRPTSRRSGSTSPGSWRRSGFERVLGLQRASPHHPDCGGGLAVTDELCSLFWPVRSLSLRRTPATRSAVARRPDRKSSAAGPSGEVAALTDKDARENWSVMLGLRETLLASPTLEAAYLKLVRANPITTPAIFLNQLVHLILRNALDGCEDPYVLRAAELFFRPQRVSVTGETVLLADAELIDARSLAGTNHL